MFIKQGLLMQHPKTPIPEAEFL